MVVDYYIMVIVPDLVTSFAIEAWLKDNNIVRTFSSSTYICEYNRREDIYSFANEADAVAFKLRWG